MQKRTKALSISPKTKEIVHNRDGGCCIFCGIPQPVSMACAHVLNRGNGGLGVQKNIITACWPCHMKFDQSTNRPSMMEYAIKYLTNIYGSWSREEVTYKK